MCSRFEFSPATAEMAKLFADFDLSVEHWAPIISGLNPILRPTNTVFAVGPGDGQSRAGGYLLSWGLPAPWVDSTKPAKPLINARAETLEQKRTFQPLLNFRCLIPATAYFEWRHVGDNRLKNRIFPKNSPLFAFAALASGPLHRAPNAPVSATVITCDPAADIAHIHNRMPVILPPQAYDSWLDPSNDFRAVRHWLAPAKSGSMIAQEDRPAQADLFG